MIERADIAGGVILNQKREILLVYNHETDSWTYPKGHVRKDEGFLETAKRETIEETGIKDIQLISELPVYERPTRQKKNKIKVMHMFLFKTNTEETKSNTKDITKIKWVPIEDVTDYFSYQEEIDFFKSIKSNLRFQAE